MDFLESDREIMNDKERRKKNKKLIKAIFKRMQEPVDESLRQKIQQEGLEALAYQLKIAPIRRAFERFMNFFSPSSKRERRRKLYSILGIKEN